MCKLQNIMWYRYFSMHVSFWNECQRVSLIVLTIYETLWRSFQDDTYLLMVQVMAWCRQAARHHPNQSQDLWCHVALIDRNEVINSALFYLGNCWTKDCGDYWFTWYVMLLSVGFGVCLARSIDLNIVCAKTYQTWHIPIMILISTDHMWKRIKNRACVGLSLINNLLFDKWALHI